MNTAMQSPQPASHSTDVIRQRQRHAHRNVRLTTYCRTEAARSWDADIRAVAERPSGSRKTITRGPRPERRWNVNWYRGGREAWEVAGLPETEVDVQDW
jgi:hypothetical protein